MQDTTALFLGKVAEPLRARWSAAPWLRMWLDEVASRARSAWPEVTLASETFLVHVAERVGEAGLEPPRLHVDGLYLACACARGDPDALLAFEQKILPSVDAVLRRRGFDAMAEEIKQHVRAKLFVGGSDGRPRILDYAGRGSLAAWVQTAAVRAALNLKAARPREVPIDTARLALQPGDESPELHLLKGEARAEVERAFVGAFRSLSVRQRNLLRQHFVDQLGIDELAALYSVHRATAARWLAKARAVLVSRTQRDLVKRLGLPSSDFGSFARYLDNQVELALKKTE